MKILVLGGGIAGVEAVIRAKKSGFDVTLVSNREYLYIYPLSIWIPTSEIKFEDATISLKKLQEVHNFELIIDEVIKIDKDSKEVELREQKLKFDKLIIAIGGENKALKGIENTLSICSKPEEAVGIKNIMDNFLARKEGVISFGFGGNPKDSSSVRGGPVFELMFNIHNLLKERGIRKNFILNFFAPMQNPGAKMGERAFKNLEIFLKKCDINIYTGKKIDSFIPDGVIFEDYSKLQSDFIIFTPAKSGHSVLKNSTLPLNEDGFVIINEFCEVIDSPDIYAIGDAVQIDGPEWRAKQGHLAEVMAKNVIHNIKNTDSKKSYVDSVTILCLMDTRDGGIFVYRDKKRELMIPLSIFGHLLKKAWGFYYKFSKMR